MPTEPRFAEQHEAWEKAAERFLQELTVTKHLATPVHFIVHTIMDVNDQLRRGRPFFVDIARDGIVLYEAPGHPLASPVNLAPEEARAEARRHYGVTTRTWRICPTFMNVSGTQVGLTVDVVAFSALRAS